MYNLPPPSLTRRGPSWWLCPAAALDRLTAYLDARPDLHRWRPATVDTRRRRELARWYQKDPGELGQVEPAAIVVDRQTAAGVWIRLDGTAAERARPILDALTRAEEPAEQPAPQVEQLGLFVSTIGGRRW